MRIALYPNFKKNNALECTIKVCQIFNENNISVCLDSSNEKYLKQLNYIEYDEFSNILKTCDIVVVIGGDGTILKCSKLVADLNIPIFGINTGRLGFMASIEYNELEKLKKLICGDYSIVDRMMLEAILIKENNDNICVHALNEIVVAKNNLCKIADFQVSINNQIVTAVRADGLIFSTPTGSTAYSLSAGGPIIEPDMECIEFTQICPFSLFARSMIFSPDKDIKITYTSNKDSYIVISADGKDAIDFFPNDILYIKKSNKYIRTVEIDDGNFHNSINKKLLRPLKSVQEGK